MVLQSIVFPDNKGQKKELYYRGNTEIKEEKGYFIVPKGETISFFTYMNMLDIDAWKKYTDLSSIRFLMEIHGSGFLIIKSKNKQKDTILYKCHFSKEQTREWQELRYEIDLTVNTGCCYFEIITESDVEIKNARFETDEIVEDEYDVCIALNICTFHRKWELLNNFKKITESRFFETKDALYQKLHIMIVDNGSEVEEIDDAHVRLVHNPNTGGSGGFKRGLEEIRKWDKEITHVVFMDDDIEFSLETLYRLYALLLFQRDEYKQESVAGRMFRMDDRGVQYTAAEIWNKGSLLHIGLNADMTLEEEVLRCNENENAEYGGWWFCCYPMEFVQNNDPLPFFIHCDDVEYGLRHGGTPIILNGIQVWHETYEYRQSPTILYYDLRNSFFVNELYGYKDREEIYREWFECITKYHVEKKWQDEKMAIYAFLHFLKGLEWLYSKGAMKNHKKIIRIQRYVSKKQNAVLWRFAYFIYRHREE